MAKGKFEYWLTDDGLLLLSAWARDGATDREIAGKIGIAESTLYDWKNKYAEISESLKRGKEIIDYEVENALLRRALGCVIKEEKLTKDGEVVKLEREIPGDVTAQIFWLKNRRSAAWRDKPDGEGQGAAVTIINDIPRVLENVNALDDIIRHPAENRDIEDFE